MPLPSLPDFDALWNFNAPAETEAAFRRILAETAASAPLPYRAELLTQLARTQSLQRKFDQAHEWVDQAEMALAADPANGPAQNAARVRCLLERGRSYNSAGQPERAKPLFLEAWQLASGTPRDELTIDAAHMLAIVDPPAAMSWNQQAFALAERSPRPAARRWRGSLANNMGWSLHAAGQFDRALEMFEAAVRFREEQGRPADIQVARWCVARCYRSLGRHADALAILRELEANPLDDAEPGYTWEELGENLLALHRPDEARPYFARAYERLARDAWLVKREPERIARLHRLGTEGSAP